jgi:RimJ/RimL family protein N-acetyltransferase
MRFTRFGITLGKLQRQHLEQVRCWRNSDLVLPYMRYREVIQPEDQVRWFEAIDPAKNWYFVAYKWDVPFALFHIRDIDWSKAFGESGGFVGDPNLLGRPEPARATLALMDFAFFLLQLQSLQAHYNPHLPGIARFNEQLGYQIVGQETDGFWRARVDAERYLKCARVFRQAALSLYGPSAILDELDPSLSDRVEQLQRSSPQEFQVKL